MNTVNIQSFHVNRQSNNQIFVQYLSIFPRGKCIT